MYVCFSLVLNDILTPFSMCYVSGFVFNGFGVSYIVQVSYFFLVFWCCFGRFVNGQQKGQHLVGKANYAINKIEWAEFCIHKQC